MVRQGRVGFARREAGEFSARYAHVHGSLKQPKRPSLSQLQEEFHAKPVSAVGVLGPVGGGADALDGSIGASGAGGAFLELPLELPKPNHDISSLGMPLQPAQ